MTDCELVRQARQGVRAAGDELVRRWAARVLAFCHARVGDAHTAEDLAQEALLRGLRGLDTLADPEKFGSWLCGIAVRVCLDWRKAKQSTQVPFTVLEHGEPFDAPDNGDERHGGLARVDRADELRRLMNEVEALPEKHREVLLLYYYQDVTYQDLAGMLEVSTATINARLTEARAMLRQRLTSARGCE
jgi:RNA polymerase sigma-70 factor (ECF subfamily)